MRKRLLPLLAIAMTLTASPTVSKIRIAPDVPGARIVISGIVRTADGTPMPGIIMHASQAGAREGWLRTASDGSYEIDTVVPDPPEMHFDFRFKGQSNQSQTLRFGTSARRVSHDFRLSDR